MRIKVSIITVVYDNVNTIEQTIQSVINQTYPDIEYIIIDGGSTDGTVEIVRKYLERIDIFISERDNGLYYAMNKGINLASGDIIGILNSDDYYMEDAIANVVDNFNIQQTDVLYGNVVRDYVSGEKLFKGFDIEDMWYRMAIPHPATFVKKDVYTKFGVFDTSYRVSADYDLMLRFYSMRLNFIHIDNILTFFRRGGMSGLKFQEGTEETREISTKYIQFCPKKEEYLSKIQYEYIKRNFTSTWMKYEKSIIAEIKSIIEKGISNRLVIFGTGIWAERCFQFVSKLEGTNIDFFADNDSAKWGQTFYNITIIPPKQLINYSGHVLIGTLNYEQEIYSQLKELDSSLNIVRLSDLAQKLVRPGEM